MNISGRSLAKLTVVQLIQSEALPGLSLARRWWAPIALAMACIAFAELGHLLQVVGAPMATLWPAAGLYLSASSWYRAIGGLF